MVLPSLPRVVDRSVRCWQGMGGSREIDDGLEEDGGDVQHAGTGMRWSSRDETAEEPWLLPTREAT